MNCPECGAKDALCKARFDELLDLEFSDAEYGAVHHLTVATYMLQHSSRLSREGWLHQRDLLREFVVENTPPEIILKRDRQKLDSGNRNFNFKSKDGRPVITKSSWEKTILDVRTESAKVYRVDVKAWARSVLEEAEVIFL